MNIKAEIGKLLEELQRDTVVYSELPLTHDKHSAHRADAETALLQLFDKSVERVIGEDEQEPKDILWSYPFKRNQLREKQRQTWNKIRGNKNDV